ncbi:MAG: hypothetical protein NTV19_03890, partial [Burkholderiales bacterium]|nr:hypothetical protein [Burkholderiales bacterium]
MTETATVALIDLAAQALGQARAYRDTVLKACRERVALGAKAGADADSEQRAMHGYAWVASYLEALAQLLDWAQRLQTRGAYSTLADDYLAIGFSEYLQQLRGGLPMSQSETVRPLDFGLSMSAVAMLYSNDVEQLIALGNEPARRAAVVAEMAELGVFGLTIPQAYGGSD